MPPRENFFSRRDGTFPEERFYTHGDDFVKMSLSNLHCLGGKASVDFGTMGQEKDEVRRLLDILHTFMRMLAVSNREVERRLDLKHGTISRLLGGQIEAKLELVLSVARAIGLEYEEFFAFAYPGRSAPRPESEAARKLRSMLEDLQPPRSRGGASAGSLERTELFEDVKRAMRELMEEMAAESAGRARARMAG